MTNLIIPQAKLVFSKTLLWFSPLPLKFVTFKGTFGNCVMCCVKIFGNSYVAKKPPLNFVAFKGTFEKDVLCWIKLFGDSYVAKTTPLKFVAFNCIFESDVLCSIYSFLKNITISYAAIIFRFTNTTLFFDIFWKNRKKMKNGIGFWKRTQILEKKVVTLSARSSWNIFGSYESPTFSNQNVIERSWETDVE